ncbi:hypothetical protein T492DRAFT_1094123 [Pavlovales sp. CCMP2436]|nr:hypothetical protein T492DRAFT_1094123 [Pavlovales sp. CCMP2436]
MTDGRPALQAGELRVACQTIGNALQAMGHLCAPPTEANLRSIAAALARKKCGMRQKEAAKEFSADQSGVSRMQPKLDALLESGFEMPVFDGAKVFAQPLLAFQRRGAHGVARVVAEVTPPVQRQLVAKPKEQPAKPLFRCPCCTDAFISAWDREDHFDAYHIVLERTLLTHTPHPDLAHYAALKDAPRSGPGDSGPVAKGARLPAESPGETRQPAKKRARKPATAEEEEGEGEEGGSVPPSNRSKYRFIYHDARRTQWFTLMFSPPWRSARVSTEAQALAHFAAEAGRRGLPDTVPPLRKTEAGRTVRRPKKKVARKSKRPKRLKPGPLPTEESEPPEEAAEEVDEFEFRG